MKHIFSALLSLVFALSSYAGTTNNPGVPVFGAPPAPPLTYNYYGTAIPNGSITAGYGSIYIQNTNGVFTQWVKTNGSGNTGWGIVLPLSITNSDTIVNASMLGGTLAASYSVATNFVTPQMFGAKGDGVTDDSAALQSMLNHAGEIFLPTGNYLCTNLYVTNNTYLHGSYSTRIVQTVGATNWLMSVGNNTNIQIEGLVLDGSLRAAPASIGTRNGINMNLGTNGNSWIRYCDFIGFNGIGIHAFEPGGVLSAQNYKVGYVDHCRSEFCGIGADQLEVGSDSCEYSTWTANEAVSCLVGVNKNAGNVANIGWRISNTATGVRLYAGNNGNHGTFTSPVINHCVVAVAATNIQTGESFIGGDMLAGGQIILDGCTGVQFSGVTLSGTPPIMVIQSPSGAANVFNGCRFQGDWALCKQTITNDGGGVFFGNLCWNAGGVTNTSDGSFGNGSLVIKPMRYFIGSAIGGTLSGQNFAPTPYYDVDWTSWAVDGGGGFGFYIPALSISPCTNSIVTATILNTNTATVTVTNFAPVIMYFGNSGRQFVHPILSNTVTFAQGYNTLTWTNYYTNTAPMTRVIGFELGVGDHVQTGYLTKFQEQPLQ